MQIVPISQALGSRSSICIIQMAMLLKHATSTHCQKTESLRIHEAQLPEITSFGSGIRNHPLKMNTCANHILHVPDSLCSMPSIIVCPSCNLVTAVMIVGCKTGRNIEVNVFQVNWMYHHLLPQRKKSDLRQMWWRTLWQCSCLWLVEKPFEESSRAYPGLFCCKWRHSEYNWNSLPAARALPGVTHCVPQWLQPQNSCQESFDAGTFEILWVWGNWYCHCPVLLSLTHRKPTVGLWWCS